MPGFVRAAVDAVLRMGLLRMGPIQMGLLGMGAVGCAWQGATPIATRAPVVVSATTSNGPTTAVPADADTPAESPRAHLPPEAIELDFDQGDRRLTGTLTLPARHRGERVPAVLIVHGSGPLSRDGVMRGQLGLGFGFELPVYARLASALASHGYAVYRYDKRTCGSFNGCADNDYPTVPPSLRGTEFTIGAYRQDALAALAALASHEAVDATRIFVVGHSQGASLVPLLLADRPELRAGVMLAPPFHSIGQLVARQSATVYWAFSAAGEPERAERECQVLATAALALDHLEAGTHLGEPILGQAPETWASWIELSHVAPEVASDLDRPLLVLGGGYDYNVSVAEIAAWKAHLGHARIRHRVRVLPCVTHALNCITQPDPKRIHAEDIGHEIAPTLVSELVAFLDEASARPGRDDRTAKLHRQPRAAPVLAGSPSPTTPWR